MYRKLDRQLPLRRRSLDSNPNLNRGARSFHSSFPRPPQSARRSRMAPSARTASSSPSLNSSQPRLNNLDDNLDVVRSKLFSPARGGTTTSSIRFDYNDDERKLDLSAIRECECSTHSYYSNNNASSYSNSSSSSNVSQSESNSNTTTTANATPPVVKPPPALMKPAVTIMQNINTKENDNYSDANTKTYLNYNPKNTNAKDSLAIFSTTTTATAKTVFNNGNNKSNSNIVNNNSTTTTNNNNNNKSNIINNSTTTNNNNNNDDKPVFQNGSATPPSSKINNKHHGGSRHKQSLSLRRKGQSGKLSKQNIRGGGGLGLDSSGQGGTALFSGSKTSSSLPSSSSSSVGWTLPSKVTSSSFTSFASIASIPPALYSTTSILGSVSSPSSATMATMTITNSNKFQIGSLTPKRNKNKSGKHRNTVASSSVVECTRGTTSERGAALFGGGCSHVVAGGIGFTITLQKGNTSKRIMNGGESFLAKKRRVLHPSPSSSSKADSKFEITKSANANDVLGASDPTLGSSLPSTVVASTSEFSPSIAKTNPSECNGSSTDDDDASSFLDTSFLFDKDGEFIIDEGDDDDAVEVAGVVVQHNSDSTDPAERNGTPSEDCNDAPPDDGIDKDAGNAIQVKHNETPDDDDDGCIASDKFVKDASNFKRAGKTLLAPTPKKQKVATTSPVFSNPLGGFGHGSFAEDDVVDDVSSETKLSSDVSVPIRATDTVSDVAIEEGAVVAINGYLDSFSAVDTIEPTSGKPNDGIASEEPADRATLESTDDASDDIADEVFEGAVVVAPTDDAIGVDNNIPSSGADVVSSGPKDDDVTLESTAAVTDAITDGVVEETIDAASTDGSEDCIPLPDICTNGVSEYITDKVAKETVDGAPVIDDIALEGIVPFDSKSTSAKSTDEAADAILDEVADEEVDAVPVVDTIGLENVLAFDPNAAKARSTDDASNAGIAKKPTASGSAGNATFNAATDVDTAGPVDVTKSAVAGPTDIRAGDRVKVVGAHKHHGGKIGVVTKMTPCYVSFDDCQTGGYVKIMKKFVEKCDG